jgi:acyl-CoA thioester hydrolase
MISASISISVPFHDIDILGVAWHGHYVKYCELARTELMRKLGLDWPELQRRNIVMPVVHFSCDYRSPLLYGVSYEIEAIIADPLLPKFSISYKIRESGKVEILAKAKTEQVYVSLSDKEVLFCLPADLEKDIRVHMHVDPEQRKQHPPETPFWRK